MPENEEPERKDARDEEYEARAESLESEAEEYEAQMRAAQDDGWASDWAIPCGTGREAEESECTCRRDGSGECGEYRGRCEYCCGGPQ